MSGSITAAEIAVIRSIKKTAIVLIVLFRLGRPATAKEVAEVMGVREETAGTYLKDLVALGIVAHHGKHRGYFPTHEGKQLILGLNFDPGRLENPENADFLLTTTTTFNKNVNGFNEEEVVVVDLENPENADFLIDDNPEKPDFLILEALKEAGISNPRKREELARLPHINPEYVRAHAKAHKQESGRRRHVALLITKLQDGDPMPEIAEKKDYAGGKFSDFIER